MSSFWIYIFLGMPFFLIAFVLLARKKMDIDIGTLIGMIVASILPFMREFILIFLIYEVCSFKININMDTVIFKKKIH